VTTSNSFFFTVTAADIVREMMLNVGALGEAETPTAQEYNDCLRKLNMIAKQWMGKQDFAPGLKMWTRQRCTLFLSYTQFKYQLGPTGDNWAAGVTGGSFGSTHITNQLTATGSAGDTSVQVGSTNNVNIGDYVGVQVNATGGTGSNLFWTTVVGTSTGVIYLAAPLPQGAASNNYVYNYTTKGQRPLNIQTSILRDSFGNDTPQNVMTLEDYEMLPNKTQPQYVSDPTAYYYESQIGPSTATSNGVYYLDVAGEQDVTKHLHIVWLQPVMDLNNPGDNPEYPQQWYRALCWGGAREICGMFDAVWTEDMNASYTEAMMMGREADSEITSMYFQPNAGSPYDP
jgi:hypothetical protein